jgi:hypothetical protein
MNATQYYLDRALDPSDGEPILLADSDATLFQITPQEAARFNLPASHWFLVYHDSHGTLLGKVFATREEVEELW